MMVSKSSNRLIRSALSGNVRSIERLASQVKSTQDLPLASAFIQVLYRQLSNDTSPCDASSPRISNLPKTHLVGLSHQAQTAIQHLKDLFSNSGYVHLVRESLSKPRNWKIVWTWMYTVILDFIVGLDPATCPSHALVHAIDIFIMQITVSDSYSTLQETIAAERLLIPLFTSLWLTDIERNRDTLSLCTLLDKQFWNSKDFIDTFGGTVEDIVTLIFERVESSHLRWTGTSYSFRLRVFTDLIHHLGLNNGDLCEAFVAHGICRVMVSAYNRIPSQIALEQLRGMSSWNPPLETISVSVFGHTNTAFRASPVYMVESLKANILPAILASSHVYVDNDGHPIFDSNTEQIKQILECLQSHLDCYPVHRQVLKSLRDIDARKLQTRELVFTPYFTTWVSFRKEVQRYSVLKEEFKAQKRHPCNNPFCPRKGDKHRNFRTMRCSRCQAAVYCSSSCQQFMWKLHRLDCDAKVRMNAGLVIHAPESATFKECSFYEFLIFKQLKQLPGDAIQQEINKFLSDNPTESLSTICVFVEPGSTSFRVGGMKPGPATCAQHIGLYQAIHQAKKDRYPITYTSFSRGQRRLGVFKSYPTAMCGLDEYERDTEKEGPILESSEWLDVVKSYRLPAYGPYESESDGSDSHSEGSSPEDSGEEDTSEGSNEGSDEECSNAGEDDSELQ